MANETGVMFDEFVEGGARLDDVVITIKTARFSEWDYRGKVAKPVLALKLNAVDPEGKEHEEYLSSGELKFFVPSSDGKKAVPVGGQTKLNMQTNAVAFLLSLINADTRGEMAAKIRGTDDISVLDGLVVHVVQKAQPKRANLIQAPEVAGQSATRQPTTQMVVDKVISYPWEAKGAPAAAAKAAPVAASSNGSANGDLPETTAGILMAIVGEAGGSIKKAQIGGKVFAMMKGDPAPQRNAVLGLIVTDAFLKSETLASVGLSYDADAGTVSMG